MQTKSTRLWPNPLEVTSTSIEVHPTFDGIQFLLKHLDQSVSTLGMFKHICSHLNQKLVHLDKLY